MTLILDVRKQVIQQLWEKYVSNSKHIAKIVQAWPFKTILWDHLAIIDLPGPHTGIGILNQIFSSLAYCPQGRDYLPEKQNEFMWLAPYEAQTQKVCEAFPQLVLADFVLEDMPYAIRDIVWKYASRASPFPWRFFHRLCGEVYHHDVAAAQKLIKLIVLYCSPPTENRLTVKEYLTVKETNELLAWVLIFGRTPNHFGLAVYPQEEPGSFSSLAELNHYIQDRLNIPLNDKNGLIKGNADINIAQSATEGEKTEVVLKEGKIEVHSPFVEFVWRAAKIPFPVYWKDYYQGFIGQQATDVIESLYTARRDC